MLQVCHRRTARTTQSRLIAPGSRRRCCATHRTGVEGGAPRSMRASPRVDRGVSHSACPKTRPLDRRRRHSFPPAVKLVISTKGEAAVERPPHFAFAVAGTPQPQPKRPLFVIPQRPLFVIPQRPLFVIPQRPSFIIRRPFVCHPPRLLFVIPQRSGGICFCPLAVLPFPAPFHRYVVPFCKVVPSPGSTLCHDSTK